MKKIVNGTEMDCTDEEIVQRALDEASAAQIALNENNRPILAQLVDLDAKTIRALREGNQDRIKQLEAEAAELRKGLIK